jgi:hypothetical protein
VKLEINFIEEMVAERKDRSFGIHWSRVVLETGVTTFFITDILYGKMIEVLYIGRGGTRSVGAKNFSCR